MNEKSAAKEFESAFRELAASGERLRFEIVAMTEAVKRLSEAPK